MANSPIIYGVAPGGVVRVPANPLVPGDTGGWTVWYQIPSGASGISAGSGGGSSSSTGSRKGVSIPPTASVATVAVPAQPATTGDAGNLMAQILRAWKLGWTSAARSVVTYSGDLTYTFSCQANCTAIVSGLSLPRSQFVNSPWQIDYGFYITGGRWFVAESGAVRASGVLSSAAPVFVITRAGTKVTYSVDGSQVYASAIPFQGDQSIVGGCLYSATDSIVNASVSVSVSATAQGSAVQKAQTITGYTGFSGAVGVMKQAAATVSMTATVPGWGGMRQRAARVQATSGYNGQLATGRMTQAAATLTMGSGEWGTLNGIGMMVQAPQRITASATVITPATGGMTQKAAWLQASSGWNGLLASGSMRQAPSVVMATSGWWIDFGSYQNLSMPGPSMSVIGGDGVMASASLAIPPPTLNYRDFALTCHMRVPGPVLHGRAFAAQVTGGSLSVPGPRMVTYCWRLSMPKPRLGYVEHAAANDGARLAFAVNPRYEDGPEVTQLVGGWADFIRIGRVGNEIYGLKADGLYRIGGATFAGTAIDAMFQLHPNKYDWNHLQKCRLIYGGFSSAALITPILDGVEQGDYATWRGQNDAQIVRLPGGLIKHLWAFRIRNIEGQALRASWMEPRFEQLQVQIA